MHETENMSTQKNYTYKIGKYGKSSSHVQCSNMEITSNGDLVFYNSLGQVSLMIASGMWDNIHLLKIDFD